MTGVASTLSSAQDGPDSAWATAHAVTAVAEDLAGEFSLQPLLERILLRCTELLQCDAGSVCSVDEVAGTYRKEADIGIRCQSGQVFPLSEGMTGAVVAQRGPLWFARYEDVRGGHVNSEDRATLRGVIGVPLEWGGQIIGVCVVFSRDEHRVFGSADAELLKLFAKHAAVALTNARLHDVAEERTRAQATAAERERLLREVYDTLNQGLVGVLGHLDMAEQVMKTDEFRDAEPLVRDASSEAREALVETRRTMLGLLGSALDGRSLEAALDAEADWARRAGRLDVRLVTAGDAAPLDPALSHEILRIAQEALTNIVQHAEARTVRIGVAYESLGVALLVQDDGCGFDPHSLPVDAGSGLRRMADRAHAVGGRVELDSMPAWGTSLRVRFPYARSAAAESRGLRVLVVDPQPVLRAGVARLLTQASVNLEVAGEAAGVDQAIKLLDAVGAAVVVASLRLGDGSESDVDALSRLLSNSGNSAVLCLSAPGDEELVVAAVRAGAHGCLDNGVDGPALAQAVVAAGRGQAVLSGIALQRLHRGLSDDFPVALTNREREVRALIDTGLPDKLIAAELMISVKTVEKHVSSLLRKSGVHNRTELVALARRR
ncbi:MAG TPA: hybrid sensor histidine kinase/response regulator transcription factor [Mycobacteriales bacterium]|nr:hybrid sensor histidine kinase/response regulator transcription factor [Mycobacteriales bacterium]